MNYLGIFQSIISWGFYLLFFIVPLIFLSKTSELFEFNKMMTVYFGTIIIVTAWVGKMILAKKIIYRRTFMDIPLLVYLGSHLLSVIFSLDTRTSIFGYYSRFHEGLLASLSYILLYFAAVSNLTARDVKNIFYSSFFSGIIIAVWGTFEHFGHSLSCLLISPYNKFDVGCWVQDVKNRVYATLGQPNWMAAYMNVLILTTLGFLLKFPFKSKKLEIGVLAVNVLFFASLLFTKSRSGIFGLGAGLGVFLLSIIYAYRKESIKFLKNKLLILTSVLFIITALLFGVPLPNIESISLEKYLSESPPATNSQLPTPNSDAGYIDIGISTSSDIRQVVWGGAVKVWQRYPVFGSGVETFAYAYYKDRPAAHNMLSEWDFLYNKAHNEYLNLLATTGTVGILAYLLIHVAFIRWFILNPNRYPLTAALFAAWISILVTNLLGFSVVIIGLFFFLIPAFCYLLTVEEKPVTKPDHYTMDWIQWSSLGGVLIFAAFLLTKLLTIWQADIAYAFGQNLERGNQSATAFQKLRESVSLVPDEPLYRDELSQNATTLAIAAAEEKDATLSAQLAALAVRLSDSAVTDSPNNVVFWKNRARILYTLSQLDPQTLKPALEAILKAVNLAPTDARIHYFAGLLLDANNDKTVAVKMLEETVNLKIDYRDARFQLAKEYLEVGDKMKALEQANFIITRLGDDAEVKKWLEENKL